MRRRFLFANPWRKLGGLPRAVWILFATSLINRAGTMVLPFFILYLTRSLHFSAGHAGAMLAVYGGGALVAAPLSGRLCDRYGAAVIMRTSLLVSGVVLFLYPLAQSLPIVTIATLLFSLSNEMFRPANLSIVSELVPATQRKAAFAVNRLAINLGMSIGPALGGFLATVSFPWLFYVDGLTSIAAALVLLFAFHPPGSAQNPTSRANSPGARRAMFAAFADPHLLVFLAAVIPVGVVFFQHEAAMPLYMVRDLYLSEKVYGLMFTLNTVIIVFIEVPLNTATAHWSHRRTLSLGALLFATGFGGMALCTGLWSLAVTVVIWTFAEMILFPGMAAYVADIAPPERRGEYMGLYSMSLGFAFSVGPWLGTEILERWGGRLLWGSMFLLGALSAAMMSRLTLKTTP